MPTAQLSAAPPWPEDDRLDRLFRALADRTRRALLARLGEGPAMVTELARPFDMTLAAVGKHLRMLERAGLIERQVDGRVHTCSLNAQALRDAEQWLAHYRRFWDDNLAALAAYSEGREG